MQAFKSLFGLAFLVLVLCTQVNRAESHTDYMGALFALSPEAGTARGYTFGRFYGQPTCSTRNPLEFGFRFQDLAGTITGITLRFGGQDGTLHARVGPDDRAFAFDSEDCSILTQLEGLPEGAEGIPTPMFLTIETDLFPDGEIGGQIFLVTSAPTLESSWGKVKKLYR